MLCSIEYIVMPVRNLFNWRLCGFVLEWLGNRCLGECVCVSDSILDRFESQYDIAFIPANSENSHQKSRAKNRKKASEPGRRKTARFVTLANVQYSLRFSFSGCCRCCCCSHCFTLVIVVVVVVAMSDLDTDTLCVCVCLMTKIRPQNWIIAIKAPFRLARASRTAHSNVTAKGGGMPYAICRLCALLFPAQSILLEIAPLARQWPGYNFRERL